MDGNEVFVPDFVPGCCAPTIPTGSRSCFDTLRTKPSRKINLVRLELLPHHFIPHMRLGQFFLITPLVTLAGMMQCIICVGDKVFDVFLQMMAEKVSSTAAQASWWRTRTFGCCSFSVMLFLIVSVSAENQRARGRTGTARPVFAGQL